MAALRTASIILLALTVLSTAPPTHGDEPAPLLIILDASGSMWGQIDGENKIVIARRVLGELVDGLPDAGEVGLIAYGHRREGDCADIETVVPLGPLDKAALKNTANALNPKGKTPITASVQQAFELLRERDDSATVILVSDGLETCDADPCAAVRLAKEQGLQFLLHVVGFDVAGEDTSQLECAAQAGDGQFFGASNAGQLGEALEVAVAIPPEIPPGRLSVKAIADGALQDVAVHVLDADTGKTVNGGRTYAKPETNPRILPLADGRYVVEVKAAGIKGDNARRFEIEIVEGSLVEKTVDFSTGQIEVGATRNGELSDVTYRVYVAGTREQVASGRTYRKASSNPSSVRITAGAYDVELGAIEIAGKPAHRVEGVELEPGGQASIAHDFSSGTLRVGASMGEELIDAVVKVRHAESGTEVDGSRTYTNERSNPSTFTLQPGRYTISVRPVRPRDLAGRDLEAVTIDAGAAVERLVDFGDGS